MSQRRIVEYVFTGSTRGFEAAQNRIFSGLSRTSNQSRRAANDLGMIDSQLRAIGTTARYALAGSLVFGITGAIQRLTDFQNQLGVVAGLAGSINARTGAYNAPSQGFLSNVGDEAQLAANRVGIATEDIQNYMARFYSTFQENPNSRRARTDMRNFVAEVSRLQAMLGAEAGDPQQLAGGIAGFVNQIPGGRRNIGRTTNRVANLVAFMTTRTPNVTGRDISRDIGRVGATMTQTGMTPEQVFAIWTQAGLAGGSASVIGRGIAQLLGNVLHPTTPRQIATYQSLGLPTDPATLRRMGTFNVIRRMLRGATTGQIGVRNPGALNDENIDDPGAAISAAGVRGINLNTVYGLFSRQESARQFVNLLGQGGTRALDGFIRSINKAENANEVFARETAAIHQRSLARFTEARRNISLSLARGIAYPLEHGIAPPVLAASNFLAGHDRARTAVDAALGAVLLRAGVRRFLRMRGAGGGGAAGLALSAEAAPQLLAGAAQPTGARDNPIWVMIHPASWYVGGPGGMGGGTQTRHGLFSSVERKAASFVGSAVGAVGIREVARRYGIRTALRVYGPEAARFLGPIGGAITVGGLHHSQADLDVPGHALNNFRIPAGFSASKLGDLGPPLLAAMESLSSQGIRGAHDITVSGEAKADLTIRLVDAQGRQIVIQEHKGVPVKQWTAKQFPSSQGKKGTRKGH